jgi:RNA polymerase sigma-70 factor (ECF subfamily)
MAKALDLEFQTSTDSAGDDDAAAVLDAIADPAAFDLLYRRYVADVYHYCYRRLNDREASEDATSHIFIKALAALPGIRDRPFRPWLFAIAHNVLVDIHRGNHRIAHLGDLANHADPSPSPESVALHEEGMRTIRLLLSQLPDRERRVVELRLVGLSGAEIAQSLGCSHGAVRVAHHRAVEHLGRLLGTIESGPRGNVDGLVIS